ncbi:MAG: CPBP family intramembrane glutamic endopeptidase [Acidimicrobiales bacterium]
MSTVAQVLAGLVVAGLAWTWLFAAGPTGFWNRAAVAGLIIGIYGIVAQRHRLGHLLEVTPLDVAIGVVGAAVLYGVFWVGNLMLTRILPAMARQVAQLYAIRGTARTPQMVGVLLLVGPCEEIFWRGFVQSRAGVVVALVGYAAVHLWERKAVLVLAAVAGGAFWAGLFAWRTTLVAPIVCHALWDLAVVIWFPFRAPAE